MGKTLRVLNLATSTSAAVTTSAIDLDYRFDGSPTRHIYVAKTGTSAAVGGPSVFLQAAPTADGPWVQFAEVTAVCTTTIVQFDFEPPYIRVLYAGGGPQVTIYAVV